MEENKEQPNKSNAPDFNKLEQEVLNVWETERTFEKSLAQTREGEPFVFYDGPPFATGLPHYGHILASTIKDAIPRYQTMRGRFVRRVWGWDCHGLPIENIVEKKLGISGKKQIEEMGVDKFNAACRENVLTFAHEWGKMVRRMGRWVEFDHAYKTMDSSYQESVWWALKELWEKKLIYEDRKVLLYCPRCETPLSNFEVAMDNSYKDVTENSVFVKFRLQPGQRILDYMTDEATFVLAWTTTPWTLPGNTALHVGPDIQYVLAEQGGEKYILAKERLDLFKGPFELLMDLSARSLSGLSYEPLYIVTPVGAVAGNPARAHKIYSDAFVATTEGTGVVHSAVMHGEEDFLAAKEHDLPRVEILDSKGHYLSILPEFLRGVFFKNAEKLVLQDLSTRGLVFEVRPYTHSYPHCWRCSTPLYYNALPAWFINIEALRPELLHANAEINWYPGHLKEGRFGKSLASAPEWNISRNRFWATALPFWHCGAEECGHIICIGSVAELREKSTNFDTVYPQFAIQKAVPGGTAMGSQSVTVNPDLTSVNTVSVNENFVKGGGPEGNRTPETRMSSPGSPPDPAHHRELYQNHIPVDNLDLHRPYIDQIILKCDKCHGQMRRVAEVVDCWVESASMPFAELHYPFENEELYRQRSRADFVAEYIGQTRAWFYVMHVLSVALQNRPPFVHVVTTGNILAEDGSKMSKSKNNYPDPWLLIEKYGIDAIRFYLIQSSVMSGEDFNFSEAGVREVSQKINILLYNIWSFFRVYSAETVDMKVAPRPAGILDEWILERQRQVLARVSSGFESYELPLLCRELVAFISDLSTWYLRRSRDLIKSDTEAAAAALGTLGFVLARTCQMLAPIAPFLADHIYRDLIGGLSVHLSAWPTEAPGSGADRRILEQMELVREVVSLALSGRKAAGSSVRQPLLAMAYTTRENAVRPSEDHVRLILEELNVKNLVEPDQLVEAQTRGGAVHFASGSGLVTGVWLDLTMTAELKTEGQVRELERAIQDLRKRTGLKIGEPARLFYNVPDAELERVLVILVNRKKTFLSDVSPGADIEMDQEIQLEIGGVAVWLGLVRVEDEV